MRTSQRRIGELIASQRETVGLAGGTLRRRLEENPRDDKPTPAEAGIDKNLGHRARKAEALPVKEFETHVEQARESILESDGRVNLGVHFSSKSEEGFPAA